MANFMKKHLLSILIVTMALLLVAEVILRILWGYMSGGIFIFLLIGFTRIASYILIIICLIVSIWLVIKRQHKLSFILSWIFLAAFGFALSKIPMGYYETLGGLLSVYNTDPEQVLMDSRILADEYRPMTCFGYQPQRRPCENAIPHNKLPPEIQRMHVENVLVLEDYVLLEKFGLQGVFRGFVAFRKGSDLWTNEKTITRVAGCNTCWKIRIIDGLYWYHANPSDPPIFESPLK